MIFLKIESFWAKKKIFPKKIFWPFFRFLGPPKSPKNQNFKKMKKTSGDISLEMPKNQKHITSGHQGNHGSTPKIPWKQQKVPKMQFSGGKIGPKNGATEKMKKTPGDMPIMMQNTKNQPYMTIQCLWKPVQKPEKMDYFGLKRGWI